ncbi:hypothetical protein SLE2022_219020 [Rubroshorea leprosula]
MRKFRTIGTIALDPSLSLQIGRDSTQRGAVVEEIEGLIKVDKDGHVERPQIVPHVSTALPSELGVTSKDVTIDKFTNIWARFYVPKCSFSGRLPLIVYFHGGGFCIGSAAWSCYHEFLAKLAAKASCIVMSVNYRLAPENPLPVAYEDGLKALLWVKQGAQSGSGEEWWQGKCNFSNVFLAGDSAGANIAHNVAARSITHSLNPLILKGTILIQPFFGGEARTESEKYMVQSSRSALTLSASDTYWRLALPGGANRDHPWCNPLAKGWTKLEEQRLPPALVCVSEMDILKDRNLELCAALAKAGRRVEHVVYKGVGHAFQVLSKSQTSQTRTLEMMAHIRSFVSSLC